MAFLCRAFDMSTGKQVPDTEVEKHTPGAAVAYLGDLCARYPTPSYSVRVMHTPSTSEGDFIAFHDLAAARSMGLEPTH